MHWCYYILYIGCLGFVLLVALGWVLRLVGGWCDGLFMLWVSDVLVWVYLFWVVCVCFVVLCFYLGGVCWLFGLRLGMVLVEFVIIFVVAIVLLHCLLFGLWFSFGVWGLCC